MNDEDDEVVYFEFNSWSADYWPDGEPYISWIIYGREKNNDEDDESTIFDDEDWVKENELCVLINPLDMSLNYSVTAKKSWVEDNCPNLLTENSKFLRYPEEGEDLPYGRCGQFLEYSDENVGITYGDWC